MLFINEDLASTLEWYCCVLPCGMDIHFSLLPTQILLSTPGLRLTPAISPSVFNYGFSVPSIFNYGFNYMSAEGCQIWLCCISMCTSTPLFGNMTAVNETCGQRLVIYLVMTGILKHLLLLSLSKYDRLIRCLLPKLDHPFRLTRLAY